jgi:putative flippase GtrA
MKTLILNLYRNSLVRFLFVGGFGTITNLLVFFVFGDLIKINPNGASVLAFSVAVTQNYIFNHLWSFKKHVDYPLSWKKYLNYVLLNIFGLVINLLVLNIILVVFRPFLKILAQFPGIIAGMSFNYIGARLFVFRKKIKKIME